MNENLDATKQKIGQSLLDILESKPFDKITVLEIMNNCGMTRQTFYNHFLDIYDLMFWKFKEDIKEGYFIMFENGDFIESFSNGMDKMRQHKNFYKGIINIKGQNDFESCFFDTLMSYTITYIKKKKITPEISFALNLYWKGVTFLITKWIEDDMKTSPEIMARNFYNSMPAILLQFYQ